MQFMQQHRPGAPSSHVASSTNAPCARGFQSPAPQVILSFPYQMASTGIIAGLVLFFGTSAISIYSIWLLTILFADRKLRMVRAMSLHDAHAAFGQLVTYRISQPKQWDALAEQTVLDSGQGWHLVRQLGEPLWLEYNVLYLPVMPADVHSSCCSCAVHRPTANHTSHKGSFAIKCLRRNAFTREVFIRPSPLCRAGCAGRARLQEAAHHDANA